MTTAKQRKRAEKKARAGEARELASVYDCTLIDVICDSCGARQRNRKADEGWSARKCERSGCAGYIGRYA